MRRYLPSMLSGGYKTAQPARFPGASRGRFTPQFTYETGLTCRLTGQGHKWEAVLK